MDDVKYDPIDIRTLKEHAIKSGRLRMAVCELAEAYVAALYSAKFARKMQVDERTIQKSQIKCIETSRALVAGVEELQAHLKPKVEEA
jgi:uncharacterized membrane protein